MDHFRSVREILAEAEPEVERRSRDDDEIGLPQCTRTAAGEGELVVGRDAATTLAVHEGRDPSPLDETEQLGLGLVEVDVRARHEHGTLGFLEQPGHFIAAGGRHRRRLGLVNLELARAEQDVERKVEEAGAPRRLERVDGGVHHRPRNVIEVVDRARRGERVDERDVIDLLQ